MNEFPQYADTAGRAVLETLRAYGITTIFGIPGTHNLELYRPLAPLGIHAVTTRHEQGAGYAADGWSQQTGLPGVVITTSGPGLQNVMSAVGTAFCESRPMIVLSPGTARGDEFADRGTLHETKDASAMAGAVAEWSRRVSSASEAVEAVHDAFTLFRSGRPRPVHIEIPLDVLEAPADVPSADRQARPAPEAAALDMDAIAQAIAMLTEATNPVIIVGGGATRASSEVRKLAEELAAPVLSSINGKGVFDERHQLSLGSNLRLDAAKAVAEAADVLVVLGAKLGEAELWVDALAPKGKVIRVDISSTQLHKNLTADVAILGDTALVLRAVNDQLGAGVTAASAIATVLSLDGAKAEIAREIADGLPDTAALGARIISALPGDAIVAGDSSQIIYMAIANQLKVDRPHSLLYMPTYATLGYGLPAAIGARIADQTRPVVTVIGDGALMFCVNELITALEQRLDLTIVCVDNGGYMEIKQNEVDRGIASIGVDLLQPDWVALAAAFGATGTRVGASGDVESCVAAAIAAGGVQLVHIQQDA